MKRNKRFTWLSIAVLAFLSSCKVFSLYPLYTDEDLIFEASLLGSWSVNSDLIDGLEEARYVFEQKAEKDAYTMRIMSFEYNELGELKDTMTATFDVHLVKVGDTYYLDLYPDSETVAYQNFLPVHSFIRIDFKREGVLSMWEFKANRLRELFQQNKIRLRHEITPEDNYVLITAKTEELQKFIAKYGQDQGAFDEEVELIKL